MNQVRGTLIKVLTGLLIGLYVCCAGGIASASSDVLRLASVTLPVPGNDAPDFDLKDLDGKAYRLSQFKGEKPVLVYFWATWCPHCVASRSQIAELRENVPPDKLEILGINVASGDSPRRLKRFLEGHPVSWPILYDADEKVTERYRVEGIPLYVLVNEKGEIVYRGHELPDLQEYLE